MDIKRKASRGLMWQVGGFGIKAIFNILFIMITARVLDKVTFGEFAILNSIIFSVIGFSEAGIGSSLVQKKECNNYHINFAFWGTIILSILITAVLLLFNSTLAKFYNIDKSALLVISLSFLIINSSVVSYSLLIKDLKFREIFLANVTSYFIGYIVVGIGMAYAGFGIWALVTAFLIKSVIYSTIVIISKPQQIQLSIRRKESLEIVNFGGILTLNKLLQQSAKQLDKLILGGILTASTLGVYDRILTLVNLPTAYLGSSIDGVLFSSLSKKQDDKELCKKYFLQMMSLLTLIMGIIAIYFVTFSNVVIKLLLGSGWIEQGSYVMKITGILIFFSFMARLTDTVVRSFNEMRRVTSLYIFLYVLLGLSIFIGFELNGVVGSIVGVTVSWIVYSILMIGVSLKVLESSFAEYLHIVSHSCLVVLFCFLKARFLLWTFEGQVGALWTFLICLLTDGVLTFIVLWKWPQVMGNQNVTFSKQILLQILHKKGA